MIALSGYIHDPVYGEAVFYILEKESVSPTKTRFQGRIGYGMSEEDYRTSCRKDGVLADEERIHQNSTGGYVDFDMTDIRFLLDTEAGMVRLEKWHAGQVHAEEAQRIPRIEMELPSMDELRQALPDATAEELQTRLEELKEYAADWETSHLYYKCPRSKDGIAVARAIQHIVGDVRIVYPLHYVL